MTFEYTPELASAERDLALAKNPPKQSGFFANLAGPFDLSDYDQRQAWVSTNISGLLLSKLYSEESQKKWFVQRNSIELGYNQLNAQLEAYRKINDLRGLTSEEDADVRNMLARKNLIEEDLEYVYDHLGGDIEAPMDEDEKSFNDRWGLDLDDEEVLTEFLKTAANDPAGVAGMLAGEIIKDAPLYAVAKALGIAHKGLKFTEILAKVNARLNGIDSKLLRGLAKVGTGVGVGTAAGAGYEAAYTALEHGDIKEERVETGAKFGGTFGVLGGVALMAKGPKAAAAAEVTGMVADKPVKAPDSNTLNVVKDVIQKEHQQELSLQASETNILPELFQEIKSVKGHPKDTDPFVSTTDLNANQIKTIINEAALKREHKDVMQQLEESLRKGTDFRGVPAKELKGRDFENLHNYDVYKMYRIGEEKAKNSIIMDAERNGLPVPADLDIRAKRLALGEFYRVDASRRQKSQIEQAAEPTPLEAETAKIQQARLDSQAEIDAKQKAAVDEPPEVPVAKTPIQDYINKNPKTALAAGAAIGYGVSAEEEKMLGGLLGAGLVAAGPGAYKRYIDAHKLKKQTMKVKHLLTKDIEDFAVQAKQLEFDMHLVLKEVEEVFPTPEDGMLLIKSIEKPESVKLQGRQKEVRDSVKAILNTIGVEARAVGVLKKDADVAKLEFGKFSNKKERGHFLHNYFPHIFRKDLKEEEIQELVKVYLGESKQALRRTMMGTIEDIQANPKFKDTIITDPVRALQTYTSAMTRTIYAKNMINSMQELDISPTGERSLPVMMSKEAHASLSDTDVKHGGLSDQEAIHYQEFEHPTLKGYVAHSDLRELIDSHFVLVRRGGMNDIKEGLLKVNNGLKRIFVFGSLFHAQALMLSMSYSLGPSGLIKGVGKTADGKELRLGDLKIGTNLYNGLAREAMEAGLEIIQMKTQDLVNPGFANVEKLLERGGFLGQGANKFAQKIDYLTWEYMHDRFKLATYLQKKQRLLEKNPDLDEVTINKIAAEFANDAYGGLNWNGFATKLTAYAENNPDKIRGIMADKMAALTAVNKRRWLNMGLFAPDWTISNLRIVGRVFTLGYKYSDGFLKAFLRGDTATWKSKKGKELLAAWNLYAAYTMRAGAITSGLWWGMMEVNQALWGNPEPTTEKLVDFWFGEESGKMPLGGGESMVISKQISEPYHWLQHPRHTLLNKMSIVPKTAMEGMYNKQWFSLKKGFPMGPALTDPDGTHHHTKWIAGKLVPISMKPFIDPELSFEEKLERVGTGFIGFPQYGAEASDLDIFKRYGE